MTNEGIMIRINVNNISIIGRNTSGVKLMNIDRDSNVKVAGFTKMNASRDEDADADEDSVSDEVEVDVEDDV